MYQYIANILRDKIDLGLISGPARLTKKVFILILKITKFLKRNAFSLENRNIIKKQVSDHFHIVVRKTVYCPLCLRLKLLQ